MKKGAFFWQLDKAVQNKEADTLEQVLQKLVTLGLSFTDVGAVDLTRGRGPRQLSAKLKNNGIYAASFYYIVNFDDVSIDLTELSKRMADCCAQLDCKLLMPVPRITTPDSGFNERRQRQDKIIEYLYETESIAEKYDIKITIENFSDIRTPFSTIDDIKYFLKKLPDIYYTLDTGNFWFTDNDPLHAADQFASKIIHVHLKDIMPKSDGYLNINKKTCDSVAVSDGIIPIENILRKLNKTGYDKGISIEINDVSRLLENTIKSLDYLKKLGY